MFKTIKWNTGSAARRFRLKNKKKKKIKLMSKSASSQAGGPAQKVERLGEITRGYKR